jgi:hypothetical protein
MEAEKFLLSNECHSATFCLRICGNTGENKSDAMPLA